jgi:DNA-directed RNA polymerase specialized sigma24 family protein
VEPTLNIELKVHEAVPVSKDSVPDWVSLYVRAARYRRLLYFVAGRVLGNPDKAVIAAEKCLYSGAQHVTAFDREGAFRSWLVRLAIDEALAILHGRRVLEHRHDDDAAAITSVRSHRTEVHPKFTGSL